MSQAPDVDPKAEWMPDRVKNIDVQSSKAEQTK
jgi:hypothetical protein